MPHVQDEDGEMKWFPSSLLINTWGVSTYQNFLVTGKHPGIDDIPSNIGPKKEEVDVTTTPLAARDGFTFGADPECFILNKKTGKHVSAEGLIPGDKENPHKVENGAVQVDGMAAEFNIDPATNFRDFNRNIESVIKQLSAMLPPDHVLDFVPSVVFDKEIFDAAPDKAKELGCSPDYNAWTGKVNPPPSCADNPCLRTASGHIHLGWTNGASLADSQHILNCCDLVKQLDWYLGGWSLSVDKDPERRRLYGKAGALRFKPYGVEYRVLSNFWLTSRDRRLAVWNRLQKAIDAMNKGFIPDKAGGYNDVLRNSIDTSNLDPTLLASFSYPLANLTERPSSARARKAPAGMQFIGNPFTA